MNPINIDRIVKGARFVLFAAVSAIIYFNKDTTKAIGKTKTKNKR